MSITEKSDLNKRIWSRAFLDEFPTLSVEERFNKLVLGLVESGFAVNKTRTISPLSQVVDLVLEDDIVVRLYLVDLNDDHVICYRVSLLDEIDHEDTDTIFRLGLNTIWDDIRRLWAQRKL